MTSYRANRIIEQRDRFREKLAETAGELGQIDVLRESYEKIVSDILRFEDEDWVRITGFSADSTDKGLSLEDVKRVTEYLEEKVKTSGNLLGRGLRLKNNHAFGRGFTFKRKDNEKIQPRFQAIIDDPENQAAIFSPTAVKELNRILFTSGNLIVVWDKRERRFSRLSVDMHIENYISDEVDPGRIKFYLRSYQKRNDLSANANVETVKEWIPTAARAMSSEKMPESINVNNSSVPVNKNLVIIDKRINKDNGDVWGVPDAFAAAPWAHIYANYLKDGGKLFHALAAISYLVKVKTETAAKAAGAKLQNGRVAQAAISGPDTEIQAMPRANSVDLYEGRPLQAAVAAALDVAVTAIAADPGTGGSYASENALSEPERAAALSRQEDMAEFFSRVFAVMGAKEVFFDPRRLDVDPVHRQLQSLGLARDQGGINQQEYRNRVLELLDVDPTTSALPEPDEFTGSQAASLADRLNDDPDPDESGNDNASSVASQGNSGAVGSLDQNGNDARSSDNSAGLA